MNATNDTSSRVGNKIGNFVYNLGPIPAYVTNHIVFNK